MARLILVDDDPDILYLGRSLLAAAGHDVLIASNVVEAMEQLHSFGADAIITDANMEPHNGFDLIKTVRSDKRHRDLPIAMLTGRREKRDIQKALELGVDDYILKPLDPPLLLKKVAHLLERRLTKDALPEVKLAQGVSQAVGRLSVPVEVRSISETGLVLISQHKLTEGQLVSLDTELFLQIGIAPPHMKTLSSIERADGYETRVLFIGADETTLTKIRAWIFANSSRTGVGGRKAA